jgi:FlaA1/EpsC-like NDP-sugar epimerase
MEDAGLSGKDNFFKGKSRIVLLLLIDILCLSVSYWFFMYRFSAHSSDVIFETLFVVFISTLVCVFLSRLVFRVYLQMWRYATSDVYLRMVLADFVGGVLYFAIDRAFFKVHLPFQYAVAAVSVGLLVTLTSRFIYQFVRRRPDILLFAGKRLPSPQKNRINVAIVGAGEKGVLLVKELLMNRNSRYHPVFFIDNDPRKIGTRIEGVPVIGPDIEVLQDITKLPIQEIIIALSNSDMVKRERVFDQYMNTGCKVMIYDYPVDRMHAEQREGKRLVRDINIEDLLFRDSVMLEDPAIRAFYQGKRILVTGAGGSIGSEICRQLANFEPGELVLLDVYENGVYDLEQELKRRHGTDLKFSTVIANICDLSRITKVFRAYKPQVVFHAAAHKHVPLMENNCDEAILNNVFGTYNTVLAAEKAGVKRFLMISTDKAVNPTNIMGATKRLCEMIIQSRQGSSTDFVAVRFGNVLGSNGSVVPLFRRQIAEGGPVTITDKRVIRYFMTIPEASQLVLRTGTRAESSEIYVLDMGKPIKIYDLAQKLISLSGFEPDKDIAIKEIGLRPGEKLYEELLVKSENCRKTEDARIFIERLPPPPREEVDRMLRALRQALDMKADDELLKELMRRIVPSYRSAQEVNANAGSTAEFKAAGIKSELPDILLEPLGIPI